MDARDTLLRELDEVVVTAFNRRQEIIQIPGALSSVGALELERERPVVNILPVFQYTSGVYAQQGATNTSRVNIRGTGARVPYATGKIRAYFNNIPLTNASGFTFIEDIDPSVVESMEVIKGPAPSVYGAGLGGTIVLNARQPRARQTGINNTSTVGEWGLFRNSTTLDLVQQNRAMSLVYSHTQSDGYRQNNELRRDAITSVLQFSLPRDMDLTALVSFSNLKSHIPSSIDSITFADSPRSAAANWFRTRGYEDARRALAGVNVSSDREQRIAAELSIFGLWHDEKEMRPFDVFYEERYTAGSRFRAIYQPAFDGLELSAGGELFLDRYFHSNHENIDGEGEQGVPFSDNREDVSSYNLFTQADGNFGPWNLSAGVNLNFAQRDYQDRFNTGQQNLSGVYDYGWILSPRIAAGYLYAPRHAVYLSLSHGFAPPSLDETLTPEGTVNPDIRPEKSWNLELGLRGKLFQERLFYDLSLYRMVVEDLLVAERVAEDEWIGRNAGQSLHLGLEAEMQWLIIGQHDLAGPWLEELSLRSTYTFSHFTFTDFTDRGNDYSGNTIPGVPDHMFFTRLFARSPQGFYLMPAQRMVGSMTMNDANTRFSESYHVTDLTAGYQSVIADRVRMDIYLRVNNLFDATYSSMILVNAPSFGNNPPRYYYPGLPRHFVVGLRWGL